MQGQGGIKAELQCWIQDFGSKRDVNEIPDVEE